MIDTVQAVLLLVIILLTVLLVVLGVQVFFILRDFRRTLDKANRVLDNTEEITESVSQPINFISTILSGSQTISAISTISKLFMKTEKKPKTKD